MTTLSLTNAFSQEQKEFLEGMMAGAALRKKHPFALPALTTSPHQENSTEEPTFHGFPVSDLCKQELWKYAEHGLDGWDRLMSYARSGTLPNEEDSFRFRFFGLFNVAPNQESLMMRCRIPAGELTAGQLRGLAKMALHFGDGGCAITTRSNIQIRGIHPRNAIAVLMALQSLGLTAKGAGVDNVRNITVSPTAGIDPQELIDPRPLAHELSHYILNQRDLFDLPRKFNIAFDGGGIVDNVADTNDIGFMAVRLPEDVAGVSVKDKSSISLPKGIYFRVELAGISGHKQLASDCGLMVSPERAVELSAAILRVFSDLGDRTDRKKARLKYVIDKMGTEAFIAEVQRKCRDELVLLDRSLCQERPAAIKHAHVGVHPQRQSDRSYVGVVVPVGLLSAAQMEGVADICETLGSGMMRLTPWQNLILSDVPNTSVEKLTSDLATLGLATQASAAMGGLVACTGSRGCKYAAADTKGDALAIGAHLDSKLTLPMPVNIHITGCPHSCAQHYVGDIGLQAVKVERHGASVDGYNVVIGGGTGHQAGIGRPLVNGIAATEAPSVIEKALSHWIRLRTDGESFISFARRLSDDQLKDLLSE